MAVAVEMPKLGNTVEECIVAKWRKGIGDRVSAGDVIADIETDKATFEVPAPVNGTLLATFFEEGALVPVYANIFVIGEPGESIEALRPQAGKKIAEPAAAVEASVPERTRAPEDSSSPPRLSPRARRMARNHDVQAESIRGSGPGGRVLEHDVRQWLDSVSGEPMSGIRAKIARRMRESLASTAQYTLHASADARGLLSLRARFKKTPGLENVNLNHLVTFCAVEALLEVPDLNAALIDGRIVRHAGVNMGFACDTPRGLLVPVIKDAHLLAIDELAGRMTELTARAQEGKISPDDLFGATFTVSNLGSLGIESFTPLLNAPQVAILGVGAIRLKPVRRDGKVEFIDAIGLSLTCDHQVIDGAPGARFVKVVAEHIENVEQNA